MNKRLASFDLIIQEQWVVTQCFPRTLAGAGIQAATIIISCKGNIIFNTRLNALLN